MTARKARCFCPVCNRQPYTGDLFDHLFRTHNMHQLAASERGVYVGRIRGAVSHDVHYVRTDDLRRP